MTARPDLDDAGMYGRSLRTSEIAHRRPYHQPLAVRVGHEDDAAWDSFLLDAGRGHYAQSSGWGRVKADRDWAVTRVVVEDARRIVGGAQVFTRRVAAGIEVGYVPRGPVLADDDPRTLETLAHALQELARRRRVRYLALQPALGDHPMAVLLPTFGFRPDDRLGTSTKTVLLDLRHEPDELLARMKKSTRANVRRGARSGLVVRGGAESDLPVFHRLLRTAGQRKGFSVPSRRNLEVLWQALHPGGHLELFLVEHDDEPVSAMLAIPFGDTIYSRYIAWSGEHAERKPNETLDWAVIRWGQAHGFHHYDFEGKGTDANVARYKAGFGGELVELPGTYAAVRGRGLRLAYDHVLPRIEHRPSVARLLDSLAGRLG